MRSPLFRALAFLAVLFVGSDPFDHCRADLIPLDFLGNAGAGLLPGNENPALVSGASGGEAGAGLSFDTDTNVLTFDFMFDNLTGGSNGGIHIHLANALDPFGTNGGIAFNLNSGIDPNIALTSPLIVAPAASGQVTGTATLSEAQEAQLLANRFYVNIHSNTFGGGELRGNIVAVPEPGAIGMALLGMLGCTGIRRRRQTA